jgi:hypothetical protein
MLPEFLETAPDAFLKPDLSRMDDGDMGPELREKLKYIYQHRHQGSHCQMKKPTLSI